MHIAPNPGMERAAFNYWIGIGSLNNPSLGPSPKKGSQGWAEQTNVRSFPAWCLAPTGPVQGQSKEPCAPDICARGRKGSGHILGDTGITAAAAHPLVKTASVCRHSALMAAGQGGLQSGAGQGCPCNSPLALHRRGAATIQKQPCISMGSWLL